MIVRHGSVLFQDAVRDWCSLWAEHDRGPALRRIDHPSCRHQQLGQQRQRTQHGQSAALEQVTEDFHDIPGSPSATPCHGDTPQG